MRFDAISLFISDYQITYHFVVPSNSHSYGDTSVASRGTQRVPVRTGTILIRNRNACTSQLTWGEAAARPSCRFPGGMSFLAIMEDRYTYQ